MSGLFGSGDKIRRSALFGSEISPFCTSPSLLKDVTMDATSTSLPNTLGLRSPMAGRSPDGRVRSMRDQEEQLAALAKENFSLKLRIYFLEERYGTHASTAEQKEVKLNIELKVEIESLRKELQEKQDLLYQAAKAIELMEESQKSLQNEKDSQSEIQNKRISDLQSDLIKFKKLHFESKINNSVDQCVECHLPSSNNKFDDLQNKINELELLVSERDASIFNLENMISKQAKQLSEMQHEVDQKELEVLDGKSKILANEKKIVDLKNVLDQKIEQLTSLQEQMASIGHEMQSGEPVPYIRRSYLTEDTELQNLRDLLTQREATIRKYETGQRNACRVIHNFISKNKSMTKEIDNLKKQLEMSQNASAVSDKSNSSHPPSPQILNNMVSPSGRSPHRTGLSEDVRKEREDDESIDIEQYEQLEELKSFYINNAQCKDELITMLQDKLTEFESMKESVEDFKSKLEMKEIDVIHLQEELRKRTCNLQGLVNKELWDKNREIERLQKRLGAINDKVTIIPLDQTSGLKIETNNTELLEENKNLKKKLEEIENIKNIPIEDYQQLIQQLEEEMQTIRCENKNLQRALDDLNRIEKESDEWQNLCSSLRERLEELATFLDSLLRSGDSLGMLGGSKRNAIRIAVDRSLDLSRSVSFSVSTGRLSMPSDQSLVQLSSLSGLLDTTTPFDCRESLSVLPSCARVTYNSHYELPMPQDRQDQEIETLKLQVETLQNQLNKQNLSVNVSNNRKNVKTRLFQHVGDASESEAWSEPDRKVSMERIGLQDTTSHVASSPQRSRISKGRTSGSSEDGSGEKDNKRLKDQIVKLESQLAEKENKILEGQCTLLQADNKNKAEMLKIVENIESIKSDKLNAEKTLQEAVSKLQISEEKQSELQNKLQNMVSELAKQKENLSEDHQLKYSTLQEQLKQSEMDRDAAVIEQNIAEKKLFELQQKYNNVKEENDSIKKRAHDFEESLKVANDTKENLLAQVRSLESERQLLQEQHESNIQHMKEDLQCNWVQKIQYESKISELAHLSEILEQTKAKVSNYEQIEGSYEEILHNMEFKYTHQLQDLKNKENILRKQLLDEEETKRSLEKELDALTLQVSQACMDRTRVTNEKLRLELEIREIRSKEDAAAKKRGEMQLKISELERMNADLHNKLVTLQTEKGSSMLMSLSRQKSDMSDYTSEGSGDTDRILVNSSPDLGIESDQGRFSSLETQNVERPLLKTLELTHSMGHLIESESNQVSSMNPYNEKLRSLQEENLTLRKELFQTRRTLENYVGKLMVANEKKKQVEKDICRQIHKTHGVLRQVRANLETGTAEENKNVVTKK